MIPDRRLTLALIAMVFAAATAPAEDHKKCAAGRGECEKAIRAMLVGQKYLGVELANARRGIEVRSVMPDSPADRAGLRMGDVVTILDGKDTTSLRVHEIKGFIGAAKRRGHVVMIIRRNAALTRVIIHFAVMQKDQIDKIVAAHLKDAHSGN